MHEKDEKESPEELLEEIEAEIQENEEPMISTRSFIIFLSAVLILIIFILAIQKAIT